MKFASETRLDSIAACLTVSVDDSGVMVIDLAGVLCDKCAAECLVLLSEAETQLLD